MGHQFEKSPILMDLTSERGVTTRSVHWLLSVVPPTAFEASFLESLFVDPEADKKFRRMMSDTIRKTNVTRILQSEVQTVFEVRSTEDTLESTANLKEVTRGIEEIIDLETDGQIDISKLQDTIQRVQL